MQFQSPKCKFWNLSQLSRQGYILGRFLLGFSQCNSGMPDWIPCMVFWSIFVPAKWFLIAYIRAWYGFFESPDLQRNHKLQKSESGPELGPKSDQELEPKSGPELEPKLGPQLGPKGGQNWKTHFALILGPFFGTNFGFSFGTKFGQVQMELRVSIQPWKSPETRVTVKEMTKPTKHNWKIMQGQHQPSFQLLLGYQNYLWETFLQTLRLCLPCSCRFEPSQRTSAKQRNYLN